MQNTECCKGLKCISKAGGDSSLHRLGLLWIVASAKQDGKHLILQCYKWLGNNLIGKPRIFVWVHKHFQKPDPFLFSLTKRQNFGKIRDKPAHVQAQSSSTSGHLWGQRIVRWQTSDCLTSTGWCHFPHYHTSPLDRFPISTPKWDLKVTRWCKAIVHWHLSWEVLETNPERFEEAQTKWIWLRREATARNEMLCTAQEVGLNYWAVPSGPQICEFRNQPNCMHMASNYRGGGGSDLA